MVWGVETPKLEDNFKGGKFVPIQLRSISVPLTELPRTPSPTGISWCRTRKGLNATERAIAFETKVLARKRRERTESQAAENGRRREHSTLGSSIDAQRDTNDSQEEDAENALNLTIKHTMEEDHQHGDHEQMRHLLEEELHRSRSPHHHEHAPQAAVEQRRITIEVRQGTNFPIMDMEPGATCDPYIMGECCGNSAKTRHITRNLDPEWNEIIVLKLPLSQDERENLTVKAMDWDTGPHDMIGSFSFRLGSKSNPFPTVENKYINQKISMGGVLSTATFEGWYELQNEGQPVYGEKRKKSLVYLRIQHIHEFRCVSFQPTQEFLGACAKKPARRSRWEIRFMTREIITQMPASALLTSRVISFMCTVGKLKDWKKWDVVQLQNKSPSEDSLHLVLSGTFNLYAQSKGANSSMYRILKGRSFGPETSFGSLIGWRGPGEGFGEGAVLMHEGECATSVCMSDSGMTLLIDRRQCERIMQQFDRREAGYLPALHGNLLLENPKTSSAMSTLKPFFKHFDSRMFYGVTDSVLSHIVENGELVKMMAGDVLELDKDCSYVYVVCYGTLSAHSFVQSGRIQHRMPTPGESTDLLGPGSTFGSCGYVGANLRAREYAELIKIYRPKLLKAYNAKEPFTQDSSVSSTTLSRPQSNSPNKGVATLRNTLKKTISHKASQGPAKLGDIAELSGNNQQRSEHLRKLKKDLIYVMYVFDWLKTVERLEHLSKDALWYLVQRSDLALIECQGGKYTKGFAIILDGRVQVKESVSTEKPAPATTYEAARGALLVPGSQIMSEASRAEFISVLMWSPDDWAFALQVHENKDSCEPRLTTGDENAPQENQNLLCEILHEVWMLQKVPDKILKECIIPFIRRISLPDKSVIVSEGEEDFSLYIVVKGSVLVYKDKDTDEMCLASGTLGLDTMPYTFGVQEFVMQDGEYWGQPEILLRSTNSFTAVSRGPSEVLVLDSAALSNPEVLSIIWLSIRTHIRGDSLAALGKAKKDLLALTTPKDRIGRVISSHQNAEYEEAESITLQEVHAIKMYDEVNSHKLCNSLAPRAAIFLCSHVKRRRVLKEEAVPLKTTGVNTIVGLVSGQMIIYPVVSPAVAPNAPTPTAPTFGSAICGLRSGDVYDPNQAKFDEHGIDTKTDQTAVARQDCELWLIDAGNYRMAIKANLRDTALRARTYLQNDPLFRNLPSFTFEKLSRLARLTTRHANETVFCLSDTTIDSIVFLADGDFKVTKETTNDQSVARLGPGIRFGNIKETSSLKPFTVFACSESVTMQLPMKEIGHLLPDDIVKSLSKYITDEMKHLSIKAHFWEGDVGAPEGRAEAGKVGTGGKQLMTVSSSGIPVRQQQKGIVGLPEYQSSYCSDGMTIFFDNVARGKVLPISEEETHNKVGRPPDEILPSLRKGYLKKKLREIKRKSSVDFLKPQDITKIMSKEELQKRQAKLAGASKLRLLQGRVDQLRADEHLREQLAQRVVTHKHDIVAARSSHDWTLVNKECVKDKTFDQMVQEEKRKKEEAILEAMAAQKENNERQWKEKMEKTYNNMNRKELNDDNNLQRLVEMRNRVAIKRRIAVWLMTAAIAVRMEPWVSVFSKVRKMRQRLRPLCAAAITIQRIWRHHLYGVAKEMKDRAANKIVKAFRVWHVVNIKKKRIIYTPIVITFLREVTRHMKGAGFYIKQFFRKCTIIQRAWRNVRSIAYIHYNQLLEAFNKMELKFRKLQAERAIASEPGKF